MKKVYFLSGLGADERVFNKLDLGSAELVFINWIEPLKSETLVSYSNRLSSTIKEEDAVIVGLSFGGMLAVEIAKRKPKSTVIILSSAKGKSEIPFDYRLAGKMRLQRIIPFRLMKSSNVINRWLFGVKGRSVKRLFAEILKETDLEFLKWALDAIVQWENEESPPNVFHIHGDRDNLLPIRYVKVNKTIKEGGHMMVLDHAEEISEMIRLRIPHQG